MPEKTRKTLGTDFQKSKDVKKECKVVFVTGSTA